MVLWKTGRIVGSRLQALLLVPEHSDPALSWAFPYISLSFLAALQFLLGTTIQLFNTDPLRKEFKEWVKFLEVTCLSSNLLKGSPRSWILHMLFDLPLLLPHFLSHFNHICFLGFCNMLITKISSRFILASHVLFLTWCFTHISHFMCNTSAFSQASHFWGLSHFH